MCSQYLHCLWNLTSSWLYTFTKLLWALHWVIALTQIVVSDSVSKQVPKVKTCWRSIWACDRMLRTHPYLQLLFSRWHAKCIRYLCLDHWYLCCMCVHVVCVCICTGHNVYSMWPVYIWLWTHIRMYECIGVYYHIMGNFQMVQIFTYFCMKPWDTK